MKIAMLGAGSFGTALGGILAGNGYDVDYYDRRLERESLSDVLNGSRIIVLCTPSTVVPYLLPYLPKNIPLVIATKGLLGDEIFVHFKDYMVISGPGFADDIKASKNTLLTITDNRLREIFRADFMSFDLTDDRKGVLMCGALKNVYAIGAGLKALKRDSFEWKEYIVKATEEMKEILVLNGARAETVNLACGISDLELTCGFPSRNFEYGDKLRRNPNHQFDKTVEGLATLKRIMNGELEIPDFAVILQSLIEEMK